MLIVVFQGGREVQAYRDGLLPDRRLCDGSECVDAGVWSETTGKADGGNKLSFHAVRFLLGYVFDVFGYALFQETDVVGLVQE